MSYKFKISEEIDDNYAHNYKINDKITLNYNEEIYLSELTKGNKKVICYGYCFDVKNPSSNVSQTLQYLVEDNELEQRLKYLNGHYIIIYIEDSSISVYTDSSSITPLLFSKDNKSVVNYLDDRTNYIPLNPNFKLDLNTYNVLRFYSFSNDNHTSTEQLEKEFKNLLKYQYKFFKRKNLNIVFQADNYHKALFAVLSPSLENKNVLVKKIDNKGFNKKFGEIFSNEFSMNYFESQEGEDEYPLSNDIDFIARNNLSNYKSIYSKKNNQINNQELIDIFGIEEENYELFNYELNLIDNYRISNNDYSEDFLIYEPLNVRELLNILMNLSKREDFNANLFMIGSFKPSLNFYNFTQGNNLREVNLELKQENLELKSNSISSKNQQFLVNVKLSNFTVSQNLDGKIKKNEIIVYPAKQKIKKGTLYTLNHRSDIDGLIYIEGFYKNENNAKRIIVTVNGEKYNIFDFYGGRYFYTDGEIDISIKYTQDYDSLSWQKASTLKVKVLN